MTVLGYKRSVRGPRAANRLLCDRADGPAAPRDRTDDGDDRER
ncbi:hypothetical protein [Rhodococcus sp. (in: high G+C Gram-positive bacteria)]|nr:hypothetical protein [Rhodococcus sp. (in: high G+C Gram-positive bacteria)]